MALQKISPLEEDVVRSRDERLESTEEEVKVNEKYCCTSEINEAEEEKEYERAP